MPITRPPRGLALVEPWRRRTTRMTAMAWRRRQRFLWTRIECPLVLESGNASVSISVATSIDSGYCGYMNNAVTAKTGTTAEGEMWWESKHGVFRVYTVGGSQAHTELYVKRKGPRGGWSWEPHYRNPCEGPMLTVRVEAQRREAYLRGREAYING